MFKPEVPAEQPSRPTQELFDAVVRKQQKNRELSAELWAESRLQFKSWAKGTRYELDVRKKFYPGWTNEDFARLLEELDKT